MKIKRIFLFLVLLLLLFTAIPVFSQTQIQTGPVDPATCDPTIGQLWFNNSTVPAVLKSCTAVNTWTAVGGGAASVAFPWTVLGSTGTPALSLSNGNANYYMSVTSNVTSVTMPNGPATNGQYIGIDFQENGTGGFTIPIGVFPANVIFPTGCTFNTNANANNWLAWTFDGTNWQPVPGVCSTTLSAGSTGTVQKAGASNTFAASSIVDNGTNVAISEPTILNNTLTVNSTAAITGNLTTNVTGITSQCTHANTSGVLSGTGADCGTPPGAPTKEPQCGNAGGTAFVACGNNGAVLYVSSTGNDSNSGKSWDTAKLTIGSACSALAGGNSSCTAGTGTIYTTSASIVLPQGSAPGITLNILGNDGLASSGPTPNGIDIRDFGARTFSSSPSTITCTITGGTNSASCTGVSDFIVGDDVVIPTGGAATSQTTPSAPTVTVIGATGSQTINYKCVGIDKNWGLTAASALTATTTAPQVFGQAANTVSSVTWAANTVTVNTSSAMPFNTGTFHVMVTNITSGGNQIGGIQLANVVSSTQLTYTLTGSGSVTVNADSSVQFVNAFVITQATSLAGSEYIVLTTDANHNFQQQLASTMPTKLYLDGINFAGEDDPGFANGLFTITSVTSNTITVQTPYTAKLSQNAVSSTTYSTSKVNQMTAFVWASILVGCPGGVTGAPTAGGVEYAVYADYANNGTYVPIGVTPYNHSKFIDYGPFANKNNYVSPPAMQLPSTPPVSAQTKVFETKITGISGNTLTLRDNVPTGVTSQTLYHSNGASLLAAVDESCRRQDGLANKGFYPVIIPQTNQGASVFFMFNAPVDLSSSPTACNHISILDSGPVYLNGTISSIQTVEWSKPPGGFTTSSNGAGGLTTIFGHGNPMFATGSQAPWLFRGMAINTSGSEVGFYNQALDSLFEHDAFGSLNGNFLTDVPLQIAGGGFNVQLRDLSGGAIPNPNAPLQGNCGNCGAIMWWPVGTVEIMQGPGDAPNIVWTGNNYFAGRGIEDMNVYPGGTQAQVFIELNNFYTFQEPWGPLMTLTGDQQIGIMRIHNAQMDSVQQPVLANLGVSSKIAILDQANAYAGGHTKMSGYPFSNVEEHQSAIPIAPVSTSPAQNTSETFFGTTGQFFTSPIFANNGIHVTASAYDNATRADGNLTSPWSQLTGTVKIASNLFAGNSGAVDNMAYYTTLNAPNQGQGQFAQMTMTTLSGRSGPMLYITPVVQGSGGSNYACTETTTTLAIAKGNGGGLQTNLNTASITGNNGDVIRFEGIPNLLTGQTVLNCYQNSYPPATPTVTTTVASPLLTGFPGIDMFSTVARADNWSGGYLPGIAQQGIETEIVAPWHFDQGLTGTTATLNTSLTAASIIDSGIATSNLAICPNGAGGAFTTTGCSTGAGFPCGLALSLQTNASGTCGSVPASTAPNNVTKNVTSTAVGGVGTAFVTSFVGVVPRISACTANADTVVATDRANIVRWTTQAGADCVVTLPQAGSGGGGNSDFTSNFFFRGCNEAASAHNAIITPTTSTINGGASVSIGPGICTQITSDNTNYKSDAPPAAAVSSVSAADATVIVTPTTGAVTAKIDLTHANTWTNTQTFPNASITNAELVNASTTVGGATCTLGSTCTPAGQGTVIRANEGVTGTHANKLAKYTGAPSTAIDTANADTGGIIGIVISGAGTSSNATIQIIGDANCVFDGATTAGNYVINSPTAAPDCHDSGTNVYLTASLLGQVIGKVTTTNGAGGTYNVTLRDETNHLNEVSNTTGNAAAANQVIVSSAASKAVKAIDFPEVLIIPAANCSNITAGNGWSIGSGGTVACRPGTNNQGGYIAITDTGSTFAQFTIALPEDWDTSTNPYIRFQIGYPGTDTGHTIIPQIKVSCAKGDGTTTDDVAFNAAHSLSTTTTNSTANQFWSGSNVQMNGTDMTGCVAGALMIVQVGRATDTATSAANFYSATVTIPRLLVVQAN